MTAQSDPDNPTPKEPAEAVAAGPPAYPVGVWGRVAEDGTVFVRTPDGERAVGQYPQGTPEEALAFFAQRYESLTLEVALLEQRVHAAALAPDEAKQSVQKVRAQIADASAVGDLAALNARLGALGPVLAQQREARREQRAKKAEDSRARKEQIVGEAERLAVGSSWRAGATRLRDLLEEWKQLPRLDRATDDALWHRFSAARTTYTRARKAHFATLEEKHGTAKQEKTRLIKEAESLSTSTDWGPTAGKYRDLMRRWKEVGPAAKTEDDALWKRFRAAQDVFFGAREAATTAQDEEFAANATAKEALLVEAEKLVPVTDLDEAKRRFRDISERWDAAGKVPRNRIKDLEAKIRAVEQAIRSVEDARWKRSDPEKSARADDMVSKLETTIAGIQADLERARAEGNQKRISALEENLSSRQAFLEMAKKAAAEFG